jgi:hypothetical protein
MEKQSNSDSELVTQERTSTSLGGQSQSPAHPFRNLVYEEEGLRLYFIDVLGQLSFHIENEFPIDAERLKHLKEVFACLMYTLTEKGWHHIDTWIPPEMETEIRFAESFGFQKTGLAKVISYANGLEQELLELRITF